METTKLNCFSYITFCLFMMASFPLLAQYTVEWQNLTATEYNQYGVYSINATAWNTSGAFSYNQLPPTESGDIEFSFDPNLFPNSPTTSNIIGLSNVNPDNTWNTIKYGVMFTWWATTIYNMGTAVATLPPSIFTDVYKIKKDLNGLVSYYKNGLLLGSFAGTETGTLYVDCAFNNPGLINNLKASFKEGYRVQWKSFENSYYDAPTVSLYSNQPSPGFGLSGAHSLNELEEAWGYVTFSVNQSIAPNIGKALGFSEKDLNYNMTTIELGVFVDNINQVHIISNGAFLATLGAPYVANDRFKMERTGYGNVSIYKNGLLVFTAPYVPKTAILDVSFEDNGAGFKDIMSSFHHSISSTQMAPFQYNENHIYLLDDSKKLKVQFENEYGAFGTDNLIYRLFNNEHVQLAESDENGSLTGFATQIASTIGFNEIEFDFLSYYLTSNEIYHLEIENKKGEKNYVKFKVQ